MSAHTHRPPVPARIQSIGGAASASPGRLTAIKTAPASSSSSNPLDAVSGAWAGFLAGAVNSAQVALGAGLLGVGVLILVAQTSAGKGAAAGAVAGGRRAARLIPGVGVLA